MSKRPGRKAGEFAFYEPVKAFLTAQGYVVRGEVRGCDLVARRGNEKPVIVELKLRFNLALVLQGIERLALTDLVYLAVPRQIGGRRETVPADDPAVRKLFRLLRLRVMLGSPLLRRWRGVEIVLQPLPLLPRHNNRRT